MGIFLKKLGTLDFLSWLPLSLSTKGVLVPWLIILLCWLPWIILAFPGDVHFDTVNQLYQYTFPAPTYYFEMDTFVDAEFLDHHPVFDTLVFGLFLDLGTLLGAQWMGVFAYTLLQVLATSFLLAFSVCYLTKLQVHKALRFTLLVFVALFPPFPQFAATMSKDTLFTLVYVMFFICMIELFLSQGERLKEPRFLLVLVCAIVLCLLTKKTGVFVVVITGIVCLIVYRHQWKPLTLTFFVPVVCCSVLIPTLLYPLFEVAPGGRQESLGPLFQQTAAFFIAWPEEVTKEEYEAVSKVLDPQEFEEKYRDDSVDPIKATFKSSATASDISHYLSVWVSQGTRHPITYLEATSNVCAGFFIPSTPILYYGYTFRDDHQALFREKYGEGLSVEKPAALEAFGTQVKNDYYETLDKSPLLSFFFSDALWASWVPLVCMVIALARRKSSAVVFVPPSVLILFLVITPTILSRYMLPLLYTVPLMVGLALGSFKTSNPKTVQDQISQPSPEEEKQKAQEENKLSTESTKDLQVLSL